MNPTELEIPGPDGTLIPPLETTGPAAAWEEIAPGRFMPRRVRGSFHGRVLG